MENQRKIFSDIYDRYIDKIYRFIFLKVNSQETAEDLTSEAFSRYWQELIRGKEIKNSPAFIYQIARNLIVDHYREKNRIQLISAEYADSKTLSDVAHRTPLEEKVLINSDLEIVKTALAGIPDNYREIIIWHYIDELSITEIAKMLNKTESNVRVILHRALKTLKNEIEPKNGVS